jgi:hypothetical protein
MGVHGEKSRKGCKLKIEWTYNQHGESTTIEIELVEDRRYRNLTVLTVPVWQFAHSDWPQFVRFKDLSEDLVQVFKAWQILAATPTCDGAYAHDFEDFMGRHGRGWSGDFSKAVEKYL